MTYQLVFCCSVNIPLPSIPQSQASDSNTMHPGALSLPSAISLISFISLGFLSLSACTFQHNMLGHPFKVLRLFYSCKRNIRVQTASKLGTLQVHWECQHSQPTFFFLPSPVRLSTLPVLLLHTPKGFFSNMLPVFGDTKSFLTGLSTSFSHQSNCFPCSQETDSVNAPDFPLRLSVVNPSLLVRVSSLVPHLLKRQWQNKFEKTNNLETTLKLSTPNLQEARGSSCLTFLPQPSLSPTPVLINSVEPPHSPLPRQDSLLPLEGHF